MPEGREFATQIYARASGAEVDLPFTHVWTLGDDGRAVRMQSFTGRPRSR